MSRLRNLTKVAPKLLLEGARTLADRVRGAPDRPNQALAWVLAHAREGDPESVLAALDEYGKNRRFLMNVGDKKGALLLEELERALFGVRAPRVLELGCYCGYSAILMASRLAEGGRLTSVEINASSVRAATEIIRFAGLSERVTVLHGSAGKVIPTLAGPFHFVLLDHWKDRYLEDLRALEGAGLLAAGSTVFADNVGEMFGVQTYLDYVRSSQRFTTRMSRPRSSTPTCRTAWRSPSFGGERRGSERYRFAGLSRVGPLAPRGVANQMMLRDQRLRPGGFVARRVSTS